jgi:hypothetical protein
MTVHLRLPLLREGGGGMCNDNCQFVDIQVSVTEQCLMCLDAWRPSA